MGRKLKKASKQPKLVSVKYICFVLRGITQEQFALNLRKDSGKFTYLVSKITKNGEGSLVYIRSFDSGI